MKDDQPLTYCRKKCGNNFHIKCLRVWIDHKLSSGDKISCPMCRSDMTNGIFDDIRRDEDEFNIKYVTHFGKVCSGCNKKNILGNLFHCLICDSVDLCHFCYESMQHPVHQKFLLKKKKDQEWEIAPQRIKKPLLGGNTLGRNGLDAQILSVNHQHQQLLSSQYRQLGNGIDLKPTQIFGSMADYCVSCFSQFKDINQEQQLTSGLSIIGQEMNKNKNYCALCNQVDPHGLMRKLSCGHGIDSLCLKKLLSQNQTSCPTCHVPILKGYITAFDLKPKKQQSQEGGESTKEQESKDSKKATYGKIKGLSEKIKTSQNSKESGISELSLNGNLLMPINTLQNSLKGGLEINGERKNLIDSENLENGGLQNTKKSSNFRIKKTSGIGNKPPINKQPIKNDINQRIREQKENLQSLIQQGEFQLVGREIFNKKEQINSDTTIRGNTFGQQNRRGSLQKQQQQFCDFRNQIEYNEQDQDNQIHQNAGNQSEFEYENANRFDQHVIESDNVQISQEKITENEYNNVINKNQIHKDDSFSQEQEEEEEEVKENFKYYNEYDNQQDYEEQPQPDHHYGLENNVETEKQNQQDESVELDDEDEEFQRQLIEEYERQFGGGNMEPVQSEHQKEVLTEKSSTQNITQQNTTNYSSNSHIQQLDSDIIDYQSESNISQQDSKQSSLTIRGNAVNETKRANSINFRNSKAIINSQNKPMSLNHKIRVSQSQKMTQQKLGMQNKNSTLNQQFELIGLSSKPQSRTIMPQKTLNLNNQELNFDSNN